MEIHKIQDHVLSIFLNISLVFIEFNREYLNYINFNFDKINYLTLLQLNSNNSNFFVEFNNNNFTYSNYSLLLNEQYIFNITKFEIQSLGNLILPFFKSLNDDNDKSNSSAALLRKLFNGNSCELVFSNNEILLNMCTNFWNSILLQGYEQGFLQLSISLTNIKKLFNNNRTNNNFSELIMNRSRNIMEFNNLFFIPGFNKSIFIMQELRNEKNENANDLFDILMYIYLVLAWIFFIIMFWFIYSIKKILNSFLNFIGIFPIQYLEEDKDLYIEILKLEKNVF